MEKTTSKSRLIALLETHQAAQSALLAELSDADRDMIGTTEQWSVKDMFAHVTFWKRATSERLAAAGRGETPPTFDDFQQLNEQTFEANRLRPWSEVIAEADQTHADLLEDIQRLLIDDITDPSRFAWLNGRSLLALLAGNGYLHPQSHIAQFFSDRGDLARANGIQEALVATVGEFGDELMPRGVALYNLACYYATTSQTDRALELLAEALRLQPDLLAWSREDSDLISLHELPAYQALYEA